MHVLNVAYGAVIVNTVLNYCRIVIFELLHPLAVSSFDHFDHMIEETMVRGEEELLIFVHDDRGRHCPCSRLLIQKGQFSGTRIYLEG